MAIKPKHIRIILRVGRQINISIIFSNFKFFSYVILFHFQWFSKTTFILLSQYKFIYDRPYILVKIYWIYVDLWPKYNMFFKFEL